jgi:hypothetical protein
VVDRAAAAAAYAGRKSAAIARRGRDADALATVLRRCVAKTAMTKQLILLACAAAVVAAVADCQEKQAVPPPGRSAGRVAGDRQLFFGMGFTDGPDTFLLGGEADFYLSDRLAVGPMLQLGLDDNTSIVAPSCHIKYLFPLDRPGSPEFVPFVQGGAGFAYLQKDNRPGDDDGFGFLLQVGGGVELRLNEHITLASTALFNLLPAEVLDEHVYFSWQVVQFGFRF